MSNAAKKKGCCKRCKCCKCCKSKPGLKHCWHPCSCCIFPILLLALVLWCLELYSVFRFFEIPESERAKLNKRSNWIMGMIFLAVATSFLFITTLQFTFYFILNEFISCKSIIVWSILFGLTVILGMGALILTLVCPYFCPFGEEMPEEAGVQLPDLTPEKILQWINILKLIFIFIVMHIYIHYTYTFSQEIKEKGDPDPEAMSAREEYVQRRLETQAELHPRTESQKHSSMPFPTVKLIHVHL